MSGLSLCSCGGSAGHEPHDDVDARNGMAWWKLLTHEQRRKWMARGGNTGVVADAWRAFKEFSDSLPQ